MLQNKKTRQIYKIQNIIITKIYTMSEIVVYKQAKIQLIRHFNGKLVVFASLSNFVYSRRVEFRHS